MPAENKRLFFLNFCAMFVPSLSWLNDRVYIKMGPQRGHVFFAPNHTRSMCGRPVTDVRRSSGMFVSTASPARCGTMMEAVNVALRPGSSKQGKAERAPVASNCVTMMGGVCGEGARVGQSIVLSGGAVSW